MVAIEKYANSFATALTSGMTAGATSASVAAGAPAALQGGQFRVSIDAELLLVTSGNATTTWTVTRGVEGTTAAIHATSAPVTHILTAASLLGVSGAFNVRAFGATGDGTTDDTVAVQAAMSALPLAGGTVYFPPGTYKITATLTVGTNTHGTVRLVGAGGLVFADAPTIINMTTLSTRALTLLASEVWLENIAFVGPGGAPTISEGVYATYNVHAVGCTFYGFYTGMRTNGAGSFYCSVTDCKFQNNTTSGIRSDGNSLTVLNTRTSGGSYGIFVSQGTSIRIIGGAYEAHTGYAILVDTATSVYIAGNYFEQTTGAPGASIFIGSAAACYGTVIEGNYFAPDGGIAGFVHIRLDNAVDTLIMGNKFGLATAGAFLFSANTVYVTRLENRIEAGNTGSVSTATETVSIGQGSLSIGGGAAIKKHLSGTATWNPGSIADGAQASTPVTVTGAAVGDTVAVGFSESQLTMILSGYVSAPDTVTVVLFNAATGAARDLASGTLRADVWKH